MDKVAVRDIGRSSTFKSVTEGEFRTGITIASFHCLGTCACLMEALKLVVSGSTNSIEKLLRIQFGSESGPEALFVLTAYKRDSTSTLETQYGTVESSVRNLSIDESCGNDLVASRKRVLIAIAKSFTSKNFSSTSTD